MNALPIYKYLIEFIDAQTVKTYFLEDENFVILKLHGGETYKLTDANIEDYWKQWKQETGYTSKELTDIFAVWHEGFNVKKFFLTGKNSNVQNVSPTTWTGNEIEKFFSFTLRRLKSKLKTPFNGTIRVNTESNQTFLIGTFGKIFSDKSKILAPNSPEQEQSETPVQKKPSATRTEISKVWNELNRKHTTAKKGGIALE